MPRLIITEGEIMLQEAMKTLEDAEAKAAEIVKEAGKKAEARAFVTVPFTPCEANDGCRYTFLPVSTEYPI